MDHSRGNDGYFIFGGNGGLYGNGKQHADLQGKFATDDRIGVLLDLDAGWMRFYRNCKQCGPGFTEGVTGPLVCAAQFGGSAGDKVTVLPGAVAPEEEEEGGDTGDVAVDYGSHSLAQLKDACRAKGLPVGGTKAVLRSRLEAADDAPLQ
jgi:hypothetical protein